MVLSHKSNNSGRCGIVVVSVEIENVIKGHLLKAQVSFECVCSSNEW